MNWLRRLGSGGVPGFVVRRILLGLIVLLMVSLVVFAATQALPGDRARPILGRSATPQSLAPLRRHLHLRLRLRRRQQQPRHPHRLPSSLRPRRLFRRRRGSQVTPLPSTRPSP